MAVLCRHTVSRVLFITLLTALVAAQDDQKQPFDCHVSIDGNTYDLTGLKGEHTVTRDSVMPPSTIHDAVTFNLCEDLAKGTVPDEDQVCLIKCPLASVQIADRRRTDSVRQAHEHA